MRDAYNDDDGPIREIIICLIAVALVMAAFLTVYQVGKNNGRRAERADIISGKADLDWETRMTAIYQCRGEAHKRAVDDIVLYIEDGPRDQATATKTKARMTMFSDSPCRDCHKRNTGKEVKR